MFYLGIDQHAKQLTICLRDEQGEVVRQRQVSTKWEKFEEFFNKLSQRCQSEGGYVAIVEVCGFNDWLLERLPKYGCGEIVLVQPTGKPKRKTAKHTGEVKPTSKVKAKKTQRRRAAKRRATSHKGEPTLFGKNVLRFCEYLGITPEDLSLAMGLHRSRIEKYCYGRDKATNAMKDQVKSLLIEAVGHPPEDQPLTVEWLRDWYDLTIKYAPPKRYDWHTPRHYEPSEV